MNSVKSSDMQDAVQNLLPFLEVANGGETETRVEASPLDLLRRFYLFSISDLVVPKEEEDIPRYIERRFMSVLSAAHRAGWTVLTAVVGSKSGAEIHLGFMTEGNRDTPEPYVFERILKGLLPGLGVSFVETAKIESFLTDKNYGGIVAGVPTLKIDDERQRFNLPSVIRSLHGEDYALLIVSRPVPMDVLANQLKKIWKVRDDCHRIAKQTRTSERGESSSHHEDHTESVAESESRLVKAFTGMLAGGAAGGAAGAVAAKAGAGAIMHAIHQAVMLGGSVATAAAIPMAVIGAGMGASVLLSASGQKTKTKSTTTGSSEEKHWSESLLHEEQNSVAVELERLSGRYSDRLMKAANVGEWETTITFATHTSAGRDILAGSLLGELAKPSTDVFPPRIYYNNLDHKRPLLLPSLDKLSSVFPRSLASYLTGEELASIASPPAEQLPGYDIRRTPSLSLTDARTTSSNEKKSLGTACDHGHSLEGVHIELAPEDLAKHLFVCGLTGTGKTTTVKELLRKSSVPFLVIESAKRDYRQLLGVDELRDRLKIYTVGDGTISPLRMNPFYVMPGVSALVHIDFLKAIFNASISMYGPMPYILEKCIHNVYLKRGWDLTTGRHPRLCDKNGEVDVERYKDEESEYLFPTLLDVKDEVQEYVKSTLEYRGELSDNIRTAIVIRLESLCVGAKGLLFGTSKALDIEALLANPTVLELEALSDDDDKAFFLGLMLTFISEYRQNNTASLNPYVENHNTLQHLLVIEEAHRLLKNVSQERQTEQLGNPRGKAIEFFANVISEMRSMGQGVVVVEQIPTKLLPDVIKNTNAKIVHRLVANDDQALLSSSLGLAQDEAIYLTSLRTGHALYLKEGMHRPVEVEIHSSVPSIRISHDKVKRSMRASFSKADADLAMAAEIRSLLTSDGDVIAIRTLCSIATVEISQVPKCVANAISEIEAALLRRDRCFTTDAISSYLSDRLVSLLVCGVFHLEGDNIWGVSNLVRAMVNGKNKAVVELSQKLTAGWNCENQRLGVMSRISELALDRASRAKLGVADKNAIEHIIQSYFLDDIPDFRFELVSQIISRLGDQQCSQ
jgi:hypothetical protein